MKVTFLTGDLIAGMSREHIKSRSDKMCIHRSQDVPDFEI